MEDQDTSSRLFIRTAETLVKLSSCFKVCLDTCGCEVKGYKIRANTKGIEFAKNWAESFGTSYPVKADSICNLYPNGYGDKAQFKSHCDMPVIVSSNCKDPRFDPDIPSDPTQWYTPDVTPISTCSAEEEDAFLATLCQTPSPMRTIMTTPPALSSSQIAHPMSGAKRMLDDDENKENEDPNDFDVTPTKTPRGAKKPKPLCLR